MIFKKLLTVIMSGVMSVALLSGCGSDNNQDTEKSSTENERVGIISHLNMTEKAFNEFMKEAQTKTQQKLKIVNYVYYDNLNSMQMGLESGNVSAISTYESVAHYITQRNDKLILLSDNAAKRVDSFCCAVRKDDTELKESLDKAITEMKSDGTIDNLIKKYITDLKADEEPPAVEIARINGADTIRVGVTGDLPPLDLILANGKPAGFNTAVLSELSRRIGKNIELISIESGARATALSSRKIDVIFWAIVPLDESAIKLPIDIDKPENVAITKSYYNNDVAHIGLKK